MNPKAFDHLPMEVGEAMPTHPKKLASAIVLDPVKLQPQLNDLNARFDQWVST
jgi:putative spermidine/putrescine transport system substrate-binding protein